LFCDHCGSSLAPGTNVCPSCGRAILPTNTLTSVSSRLERHLRPLGILWIVASCFFLFPAMIMMILGTVVHFSIPGTEQLARLLGPFVLFLVGAILFFVSLRYLPRLWTHAPSILGSHSGHRSRRDQPFPSTLRHRTRDLHLMGVALRRRQTVPASCHQLSLIAEALSRSLVAEAWSLKPGT
jgi:hypothetical protein